MKLEETKLLVVSNCQPEYKQLIDSYLSTWLRHPFKGSEFAKKISWALFLLPNWFLINSLLIRMLVKFRYDGLIFVKDKEIICHVIFQQHQDQLHMFSVATNPKYQSQGLATQAMVKFIRYAYSREGISAIRWGGGNDETVNRMHRKLRDGNIPNIPCNISVTDNNYIHFEKVDKI